jgi:hypothetical protein
MASRSSLLPALLAGGFVVAVAPLLVLSALLAAPGSAGGAASDAAISDIPPDYLALYRTAADRYRLGADGWSYLAAVGKVECDHGRSTAVGCDRGEENYAGARGPAQFLAATWAAFGVDGDGDGDRDVYDPADAVFGMANYLRASAAPRDWRRALFAYNHAGWYVDRVLEAATRYRGAAATPIAPDLPASWLAPLPDFPGESCDRRIVGEVTTLVRAFGIRVSDCFGGPPHDVDGEHPLGLAIDASPADGDWRRTELLARRFGWSEACAARGCPGVGPFRVVLYNGYPDHGDPAHSSKPHIHLSWQHGPARPFSRAPWVRLVLPGGAR